MADDFTDVESIAPAADEGGASFDPAGPASADPSWLHPLDFINTEANKFNAYVQDVTGASGPLDLVTVTGDKFNAYANGLVHGATGYTPSRESGLGSVAGVDIPDTPANTAAAKQGEDDGKKLPPPIKHTLQLIDIITSPWFLVPAGLLVVGAVAAPYVTPFIARAVAK